MRENNVNEKETAAFNKIYSSLMNGIKYGYASNTGFNIVLEKGKNRNGAPLFYWQHYGASANTATKEDLAFLLMKIFAMLPSEFIARYAAI